MLNFLSESRGYGNFSSKPEKGKLKLQSLEQLPEMMWTPSIHGHVGVTDKAAVLTVKSNDGTWSHDAFVGEDPAFLKFAGDLFNHEWEKAKPWHP